MRRSQSGTLRAASWLIVEQYAVSNMTVSYERLGVTAAILVVCGALRCIADFRDFAYDGVWGL